MPEFDMSQFTMCQIALEIKNVMWPLQKLPLLPMVRRELRRFFHRETCGSDGTSDSIRVIKKLVPTEFKLTIFDYTIKYHTPDAEVRHQS